MKVKRICQVLGGDLSRIGLALVVLASFLATKSNADEPLSPPLAMKEQEVGAIRFLIPEATQIEMIAEQPLIRWPVAASWDHDHTLLVLESNWNRESVEQQLQSKPHRIVRLTDTDNDGNFDIRTVVAEKLSFSAGLLVVDESTLLVSAPPKILQLKDSDGDGTYESESVWHDGTTITHCANDLHGPKRGLDGWIYWTKGAFAEQTHRLRNGKVLTSKAAHLLRRHPSGGEVDVLMTGGMDNPVDVAFLPDGERLFCSTFLHQPGGSVRDGVGHAIYGSLFGKPHNVINGHPRTGPLMEPLVEMGAAAPAALDCLRSDRLARALGVVLPEASEDSLLTTCQFNLQKVSLHRVSPHGATFKTHSQDLLVGDKVDFHPVDVVEDTDGSLIVLDTGGWYDLCCPSSGTPGQVAPGGIYRLSPITSDTAGHTTEAELNRITDQSKLSKAVLDEKLPLRFRLECYWKLVSKLVDQPNDRVIRKLVRDCLDSSTPALQRAALNTVSLYRWGEFEANLLHLVLSESMMTRRLAAECFGRLQRDPLFVTTIMMVAIDGESNDRALDHAILYAMIERSSPAQVRTYLRSDRPNQRWAALMVLEQTNQISPADVSIILDLLAFDDERIAGLALETLAKHPEFASEVVRQLKDQWKLLATVLPQWWRVPEIQTLVASWLSEPNDFSKGQADSMIQLIARVQGEPLPNAWIEPIQQWIVQVDTETAIRIAISLADVKWDLQADQKLIESLKSLVNNAMVPIVDRVRIASSLPSSTDGIDAEVANYVVAGLTSEDESHLTLSLKAIPRIKLSESTSQTLIEQLNELTPLSLQPAIVALLAVDDPAVDAILVDKFPQATAAKSVVSSTIMNALGNRSQASQGAWLKAFDEIAAPPDDVVRVVDEWIAKLPEGDAVRGHQVFRSSKAACIQCHQIGYVGGRIGPVLKTLGRSRSKRDLVEAIIFPSARLEQSYRSTRVLLADGRVLNGIVSQQSTGKMELICNANEKHYLSSDEIELIEPSDVSIMPSGLEQSLTLEQLADLIAFLEACR